MIRGFFSKYAQKIPFSCGFSREKSPCENIFGIIWAGYGNGMGRHGKSLENSRNFAGYRPFLGQFSVNIGMRVFFKWNNISSCFYLTIYFGE